MPRRYDRFRTHHASRRWRGHDYASAGWTFVTICTADRACLFGEIRNGIMGLSADECVAHAFWAEIPDHHAGIRLGPFVVMPNHVHGLIGVSKKASHVATAPAGLVGSVAARRTTPLHATALRGRSPAGAVSVVVRSYKSAVTRTIRRRGGVFAWQARFHDHVVRSERALAVIATYIEGNPASWEADRLRPQ